MRWRASGRGKRDGARIIYFNYLEDGCIELFAIYAKNERENLPAATIRKQKRHTS